MTAQMQSQFQTEAWLRLLASTPLTTKENRKLQLLETNAFSRMAEENKRLRHNKIEHHELVAERRDGIRAQVLQVDDDSSMALEQVQCATFSQGLKLHNLDAPRMCKRQARRLSCRARRSAGIRPNLLADLTALSDELH
jgi:hypothetical protein